MRIAEEGSKRGVLLGWAKQTRDERIASGQAVIGP